MGIPRFVGLVLAAHFQSIFQLAPPQNIDWLALDLNAIFHDIAAEVYLYGKALAKLEKARQYQEIARLNAVIAAKSDPQLESELFTKIGQYIVEATNQIKPNKGLILAVDGLAPLAKLNQQRTRRTKAAMERQTSTVAGELRFNGSAHFTPCTELMFRLDAYLRRFITSHQAQLPPKVVYSSHLVPAEGEHKIIKYLRDNIPSNQSVVIWGMDGDLIMLGLRLPHPYYIVRGDLEPEYRYNHYTNQRELTKKVLDITQLRQRLIKADVGINEFIFSCFLYGNDFLPHQPGWDDITSSFPILWQKLKGRRFFTGDTLDPSGWVQLLAELAPYQAELITKVAQESLTYPFIMAQAALTPQNTLDLAKFSQLWYNRLFLSPPVPYSSEQLQAAQADLNNEYLTTMLWVWQYYYDHTSVNWSWAYSRLFAPLIQDAATATGLFPIAPQPYLLNPLGLLFTVIPKLSRNLVPLEAQAVYEDDSPLADMYPSTVQTIIEGHGEREAYLGVPFMPVIDLNRVVAVQNRLPITKSSLEKYSPATVLILERPVGFRPQPVTTKILPMLPKPNARPQPVANPAIPSSGFESEANLALLNQLYGYDVVREIYPAVRRFFPDITQVPVALDNFVVIPILVRAEDGTVIGSDQGNGLEPLNSEPQETVADNLIKEIDAELAALRVVDEDLPIAN